MDDDLRKEISDFFLTDSSDYLARYRALINVFTNISTRSKILVDLLFSFECSLKSLIFLRSNYDEKSTYKIIRTHNLSNLLSKIDTAKFQDIASFILDENLDDISVGVRYTLEANIKFRENGSLGSKYYETIASYHWIDKFVRNESISMFGLITIINIQDIDINKLIDRENRIRDINKP
ncbi:hypothetical protein [Bacteroides uniformis]|uniref:hypothetical protein n=1 Tax=Bacteroides uniformis TaxID=820 RepID=UPI00125D005E|nr:hypothetical protein [Bacteroides uniformis]KAB3888842.1 hypothetical protein GAS04_21290 [Bacteroides uniformis]